MARAKTTNREPMPCQLYCRTRGMSFIPATPLGMSRFDMESKGGRGRQSKPMRPDKTEQDFMRPSDRPRVKAAQARVARMKRARLGAIHPSPHADNSFDIIADTIESEPEGLFE